MTDKTFHKPMAVGKWRFTFPTELHGFDIEGVFLKGMRARPFPIMKVDAATFYERHPPNEHGEPQDTPSALRGVPVIWFQRGMQVYLWPAPAHEWTLEVRLVKKVKDVVELLKGSEQSGTHHRAADAAPKPGE